MAPHDAIVCDVAVSQKIVVVADDCSRTDGRAAIHRAKFAECISRTDFEICRLAGIFEVLRTLPDRAVGKKKIVLANARRACERRVVGQSATRTERDIGPDHAIGADFDILTDPGRWVNNRSRMYFHLAYKIVKQFEALCKTFIPSVCLPSGFWNPRLF